MGAGTRTGTGMETDNDKGSGPSGEAAVGGEEDVCADETSFPFLPVV